MPEHDAHRLGYRRVDGDPFASVLVDTMDDTGEWQATRTLREWERRHLKLAEAQRVLDVGCGPGDAALALASQVGSSGEIVGIDVSTEMVATARRRSEDTGCAARFAVGDARSLDEPDGSFDVARSERALQWIIDPGVVVAEMARVLRPGGRLSLIDTDWSTLDLDVGDAELRGRVQAALRHERRRPSNVGSRLATLLTSAGLAVPSETEATQIWTSWDPDRSPAPLGCFSMESLADDLVEAGTLPSDESAAFVRSVHDAARDGRFTMSLTMYAAVGVLGSPQA